MQLTIARKLILLMSTVLLGLVLLSFVGHWQMNKVFEATNYANINTVPSLLDLSEAKTAAETIRVLVWQDVAQTDAAVMATLEQKIADNERKLAAALDRYEKNDLSNAEDKVLLDADRSAAAAYRALRDRVLVLSRTNKNVQARDLMMASQEIPLREATAFEEHGDFNVALAQQVAAEGMAAKRRALQVTLGISLVILVAVGLLGFTTSRTIASSLATCISSANEVAKGDLTVHFTDLRRDEIADLGRSLNGAFDSLRGSLREVVRAAGAVASGATELSASAEEMSSTTHQIAKGGEAIRVTTDSVAAAMMQFNASVEQVSGNVKVAIEHMQEAVQATREGSAGSREAAQGMTQIRTATDKIAGAVNVIQEIANQTNLLSLNAAIEAAKAGELGKGFAVVADEVRKLAERSSQATVEIGRLIRETHSAVEGGVNSVQGTLDLMGRIDQAISATSGRLSEIGLATREQTSTATEIARRIEESAREVAQNAAATQELSATVQEISRTASDLAEVSENMATATARFRVA